MPSWKRSRWIMCAVAAVVAYFSVALVFKHSYAGEQPEGAILRLTRPFEKYGAGGFAYVAKEPALEGLSDSLEDQTRSPFWLYEDGRPLGPAHSIHADIAKLGGGRFSHWKVEGFIFSTHDNTNPDSTGRTYWVVRPR